MTRFSTRSHRISPRRGGFTLTEVLLVLAILGVIAAMVVPNLLGRQKDAMVKTTKMSIKAFADACELYALQHDGEYPEKSSQEMIGLLMAPGTDRDGKPISPYLKSQPNDAWGQPLNYLYPGTAKSATLVGPAIWSNGSNKQNEDGGGDDVCNWK